jgi:hypothetical protein
LKCYYNQSNKYVDEKKRKNNEIDNVKN